MSVCVRAFVHVRARVCVCVCVCHLPFVSLSVGLSYCLSVSRLVYKHIFVFLSSACLSIVYCPSSQLS